LTPKADLGPKQVKIQELDFTALCTASGPQKLKFTDPRPTVRRAYERLMTVALHGHLRRSGPVQISPISLPVRSVVLMAMRRAKESQVNVS